MRPLFSTADALPKNLSLHIDELRRAVADMRWSTSPHPRATVFADGRYCLEDEPGCYSPVPVVADAVRRVLCGAGLGALRDAPVLHSWTGFTTHAAGGVADWEWLSRTTRMVPPARSVSPAAAAHQSRDGPSPATPPR